MPRRETKDKDTKLHRYRYASEKLSMAIYRLAAGEGNIRGRLWESFIELAILSEQDFPEELRAEYRDIFKTLTKNQPRLVNRIVDGKAVKESSGKAGATIPYMRNKTAVAVAERIVKLAALLNEWLRLNG
jgi:hypothetical protein